MQPLFFQRKGANELVSDIFLSEVKFRDYTKPEPDESDVFQLGSPPPPFTACFHAQKYHFCVGVSCDNSDQEENICRRCLVVVAKSINRRHVKESQTRSLFVRINWTPLQFWNVRQNFGHLSVGQLAKLLASWLRLFWLWSTFNIDIENELAGSFLKDLVSHVSNVQMKCASSILVWRSELMTKKKRK